MAYCPLILRCFLLCTILQSVIYTAAEPPVNPDIQKQIALSNDSKLKRQNEGDVEGIGGEEIDLTGITGNGQPSQPGQPGSAGNPQQPGQPPFFSNAFFPQQPFFNNGLGFNGSPQNGLGFNGSPQNGLGFNGSPQNGLGFNGSPQNGFAQGFPQGGVFQGFPQGFPQGGIPQGGFQQFGLNQRNIILQNNGKQYLVQPLGANQRVVQKNGKQYLLHPLTNSAAANGAQTFNVPNAAFAGLTSAFPQNAPISSFNPTANSGLALQGIPNAALTAGSGSVNAPFPPFSPAVAAVQPSAVATNSKLTSTAPQRLIVGANGNKFEVEQIPIRSGDASPYLTSAIGGVAAQLAAQTTGQQFFNLPGNGLLQAYSRANAAGYGQYPTGRSLDVSDFGAEPIKRDTK